MFGNIPAELRELAQWVTWKLEDHGGVKPTKVPYCPLTGRHASVSDPFSWTTFNDAVTAVVGGTYSGIGFVLTKNDPYTFIDLDDTQGDADFLARQQRIHSAFNSYSEVSPSNKGLHIIIRGAVPSGRKRSYVEVYSESRFMTMTGNVFNPAPIIEHNALVNSLWSEMGGKAVVETYAGDATEKESDRTIYDRACNAENGIKFSQLWNGDFAGIYSSQSEADFALINIISFYTKHKGQIVRMFRTSGLGQRDKARRDDYVNYMVSRSFDRMLPPIDIDGLKIQIETQLAARREAVQVNPFTGHNVPIAYTPEVQLSAPPVYQNLDTFVSHPTEQYAPVALTSNTILPPTDHTPAYTYTRPTGLVGDIAAFLYEAAPRQVPEIALVGALALMSGICGRSYNISGVGLNQYIFLLAATGSGKDGIASGIDKLMSSIKLAVPSAALFIGPSEIASPEALLKYLDNGSNCFVSLISEFALKLKQLTAQGASPANDGLKRLILSLFSMSGVGKEVQPMIYSDRQKNTSTIKAPAFSIMGESAPERFYEALNEEMIAEGLLPRFTIIEYLGARPQLNEHHHSVKPPARLVEQLSSLCGHSLTLNNHDKAIDVQRDEESASIFAAFEVHTTNLINNGQKDAVKQLWNRAHLKALKLAALISVGNNPYSPIITRNEACWAINLIMNDTTKLLERFNTGKIGSLETEDSQQVNDMSNMITDYLTKSIKALGSYSVDPLLHASRIVSYSYLSRRLLNMASFRKDRGGATQAVKKCVQILIDRGDLQEMGPAEKAKQFRTTARCFAVTNFKTFLE